MTDVVTRYFNAFNSGDTETMLACLTDDVVHHVNQGGVRHGKAAFAEFCAHMSKCYGETLSDLVIFIAPGGARAAAEFTVNGTYLSTDNDLPDASGQTYRLPGGSFFDLRDDRIARVTTYYNMQDWLAQVGA